MRPAVWRLQAVCHEAWVHPESESAGGRCRVDVDHGRAGPCCRRGRENGHVGAVAGHRREYDVNLAAPLSHHWEAGTGADRALVLGA